MERQRVGRVQKGKTPQKAEEITPENASKIATVPPWGGLIN